MFTVRTDPHGLINLALSTLGRYLTASLHSQTNLFDLAEAEQVVTFPDATLLRDLISFPVYFGLHFFGANLLFIREINHSMLIHRVFITL